MLERGSEGSGVVSRGHSSGKGSSSRGGLRIDLVGAFFDALATGIHCGSGEFSVMHRSCTISCDHPTRGRELE
jgi:hypothetical protein